MSVFSDYYNQDLKTFFKHTAPPGVKILIETSAGQKNKIATYIEELGELYSMFNQKYIKRIGFCLDTCHKYSAGYDI